MLPVGTAPNAIVFASGRLTVPDMMAAGTILSFISFGLLVLTMYSLGLAVFGIDPAVFPQWAEGV
jgi:sodium-dependent dicarboxylate transporter 2/3/5